MLKVENLSKKYGSKQILKHINLQFEPGKIYGIVGKNGAGKTTLFKCISSIEQHDGEVTSTYDITKNHIGFLETNPLMMSYMTGKEYLQLLCTARHIQLSNFEDQNIFDLPLHQYADTYSTGMKKKLAFLAILLQQNDIFILDEPFSGVDIQSNILIDALIRKLKDKQKTILISSHIFTTLSNICDEIYLLDEGSIKQNVKPEGFHALEDAMKREVVQDKIDRFDID